METVRYARIGKEDVRFGTGTFEVRLADGRVAVLTEVDIGSILNDTTLSTQTLTLVTLTLTNLTVTNTLTLSGATTTLDVSGILRIPRKADPASPVTGEIWINAASAVIEYRDNQGSPASHALVADDTTQTLTNKTLTSPTISGPTFSGTLIGTYSIGGTPTLAVALNVNAQDMTDIDELELRDAATNATSVGRLRRNSANLTFHDGTSAKVVTLNDAVQALTNKTITIPDAAPATPVANVIYQDSIVKGWVETSGAGAWTIDDDLNVSSITDGGTGIFTINWATAFASGNYAVVGTVIIAPGGSNCELSENTADVKTASAVKMQVQDTATGAQTDPGTGVSVIAIGNQ